MTIIIKICGSILVLVGSFTLGFTLARDISRRIRQLREVERILGMLEGELKFRRSTLVQSFMNISVRCAPPFSEWLGKLQSQSEEGSYSFTEIWKQGLDELIRLKQEGKISLHDADIEELSPVGQALSERDLVTQNNAILLEKENLHNHIRELEQEAEGRKKTVFALSGLGGVLIVILLAL